MTTTTNLHLLWAESGGTADPGDTKYQQGWVAEIPTYQNFNYVLNNLDKAKLAYAEKDVYLWQDKIRYEAGARVEANGIVWYCIQAHNDSDGSNPQDPTQDNTFSYWVNAPVLSALANAWDGHTYRKGMSLDDTNVRSTRNLWESSDLTIANHNAIISLIDKVGTKNLLLGNVRGELVVVDVGTSTNPDGVTELRPDLNSNSHKIYHEGNKPSQLDVEGTIPEAPHTGKAYLRQGGNWVEHVAETDSRDYGLITGSVDNAYDFGGLI